MASRLPQPLVAETLAGASIFRDGTRHNAVTDRSGYKACSATTQAAAAKRMLGEPSTPLFSITDFISLEVNQVRAFDTSATS
jgi:hypothetical protein